MKKVVCGHCGLVNLDKFVSFPHCAACGALLAVEKPAKWRAFWRQPVRPLYWMLAVGSGLGMLGLTIAGIARETRESGDKPLLVYTQIPRDIPNGQTAIAQFTLDSAQESPDDNFERVSLRLGRQTQRDFVIVSIQPAPVAIETRGSGRYYLWDELPRNTALKLALQPRAQGARAGGVLQLHATIWAAQYQQFEVRATISTSAAAKTRAVAPIQTAPEVAR